MTKTITLKSNPADESQKPKESFKTQLLPLWMREWWDDWLCFHISRLLSLLFNNHLICCEAEILKRIDWSQGRYVSKFGDQLSGKKMHTERRNYRKAFKHCQRHNGPMPGVFSFRTFFLLNPFPLFQIKVEPLNSYFSIIQRKRNF